MELKSKLKSGVLDYCNRIQIMRMRNNEVKKFKDPRRIEIYSKVRLSSNQTKAIDNLYIKCYGKKIPYIWHQYYTAYTGNFDVNYLPELLFIPEFETFMNAKNEYVRAFSDKNMLPILAQSAGVLMPRTFFSCVCGIIQDEHRNIISTDELSSFSGEAFIKPTVDSCSGLGCQVLNLVKGVDQLSGASLLDILQRKGRDWVIQERIKCHSSIATLYPSSVNTFRIMTYIWKNEILSAPAIMRIGQGGANVDNAHAGGMFIAVDKNGSLHKNAFTEFKTEYCLHPDTKITFDGYRIELFPEVLNAAKRCHALIPQIGCINWDFTINEAGQPVLIEANLRGGSIWLFQMAHGKGVFGSKTPEILNWLKNMNRTPMSLRKTMKYGEIR